VQFIIVAVVAALAIVGIWEYTQFLAIKKIVLPFWLLAMISGLFIFANYLEIVNASFGVLIPSVIAAFFFAVFLHNFYRVQGAILNIASCFFGAFYIVVPLGLLLKILYPASLSPFFTDGRVWLAYLITVTKITDVGGYFGGKLWGRSKLAPSLSPGKTLVGAISGFITAVLFSVAFSLLTPLISSNIFALTTIQAIILGGLISIFGQLGDLAESLLKRDANVKDSNNLPGIGGVLDLLDSLFFTAPILYLFLRASAL